MMSYEDTEIGALILMCRNKDELAFSELVRRYTPMMKKVISGFVDTSFEFGELYSEACMGLHSAMESFDVEQSEVTFGLYARACVYHKVVDLVRSIKKTPEILDVDVEKVSCVSGPEALIVKRERFQSILSAAAKLLSDYEYKVLVLHIQGFKTAKIASMLSKTPKSVDNAKARLFKRLRESLGDLSG